jgi:hypothetical protein
MDETRSGPGEMPPGILGAPINPNPHSGGRGAFDNAGAPTDVASRAIGPVAAWGATISPDVAADLGKINPAIASRVRDQAGRK